MAVIDDILFKRLLLAHLLRSPAVIEKASSVLDPDNFNQAGEHTYRLVWAISKIWYAKNKSTIPRQILDVELRSAMVEAMSMFSSGEIDALWPLLDGIYAMGVDELAPDWAIEHLQTFLDERKLRPILQQAASMGAGEDLNKALEDVRNIQASNRMSAAKKMDLIGRHNIRIVTYDRQETGVNYIDHILDGGTFPGEFYGLLAPTGGGKTTTGISLAVEAARKGRNVAFFSYEVELEPEITSRVYAVTGGIPRDVMKGLRDINELPAAYQAELYANWEICAPKLHLFDMKKDRHKGVGIKGSEEIHNILRECKQSGVSIDLVIVDQLLSMVDPWILSQGGKLDSRRVYLQIALEQLRDATQDIKCSTFVLHQVDNVAKKFHPLTRPKSGQAAEIKDFENNTQMTCQFGTMDHLGRSWLVATKHRMSGDRECIVQHSKTHWKIDWEEGRYTPGPDGFVDHEAENRERQMYSAAEADKAGRPGIKVSVDA